MSTSPQSPQRYAPPCAEVADVAADGRGELGGRGARLGAAFIDGAILMALYGVISFVTPWNLFSPAMANAGMMTMLGMQVLGVVVFLLVNGWLLVTRGQTVAKMLLGLRITRADGSAAGAGRIVGLRYVLFFLLGVIPFVGVATWLVDCLFIFRADRRCLHDLIADTIVVKA